MLESMGQQSAEGGMGGASEQVYGELRCHALDLLRAAVGRMPELPQMLQGALPALIAYRDDGCQLRTLLLLQSLLAGSDNARAEKPGSEGDDAVMTDPGAGKLNGEYVAPLLTPLFEVFGGHASEQCRQAYQQLLRQVRHALPALWWAEESALRGALVAGLQDPSATVRGAARAFWDAELPGSSPTARLAAMARDMYSPEQEGLWVHGAATLLLQLTRREDDRELSALLFREDLMEKAEFREHAIDTAWQGPSQPLMPLFSVASSQGMSQSISQSNESDAAAPSISLSGDGSDGGGMLVRATLSQATMSLAGGTQTQAGPGMETQELLPIWLRGTAAAGAGAHSAVHAAASGPSQAQAQGQSLSLPRRRLYKQTGAVSGLDAADGEALGAGAGGGSERAVLSRVAMQRKEREKLRAAERRNRVTLMRQYRLGELPDIKISKAAVVLPLQLLVGCDVTLARHVVAGMCDPEVETGPQEPPAAVGRKRGAADVGVAACATSARGDLRAQLEGLFGRSRGSTNFVACLQAMCGADPEASPSAREVGRTACLSGNLAGGILLLEARLIRAAGTHHSVGALAGKRRKSAAGAPRDTPAAALEEAAVWQQLEKMYKDMGEADVVLGIHAEHFSQCAGTRQAVALQVAGDTEAALVEYDTLLQEQAAQAGSMEVDSWRRERLACCERLGLWGRDSGEEEEEEPLSVVQLVEEVIGRESGEEGGEEPGDAALKRLCTDPALRDTLLPAYVRAAVRDVGQRRRLLRMLAASGSTSHRADLESSQGLEMAMCACGEGQFDRARGLVPGVRRQLLQQWTAVSGMATSRRRTLLAELQPLAELEELLEVVGHGCGGGAWAASATARLRGLVGQWQQRWPSTTCDPPEVWERVMAFRQVLLRAVDDHYSKDAGLGGAPRELRGALTEARWRLLTRASAGVRKRGELSLAREYLRDATQLAQDANLQVGTGFDMIKAALKLKLEESRRTLRTLPGFFSTSSGSRDDDDGHGPEPADVAGVVDELEGTLRVLQSHRTPGGKYGEWPPAQQCAAWVLEGDLWETLHRACTSQSAQSGAAVDADSATQALFEAHHAFQAAAGLATDSAGGKTVRSAAKAALRFGLFCDRLFREASLPKERAGAADSGALAGAADASAAASRAAAEQLGGGGVLAERVVHEVLRAMSLAGAALGASRLQMPRVLRLVSQWPECRVTFSEVAQGVPRWMFLSWGAQMLSLVEGPEGPALLPTLQSMAEAYPAALYFPYQLSAEGYGAAGREATAGVARALRCPVLEQFANAVNLLTFPDMRFKDWAERILGAVQAGDRDRARAEWRGMWADCLDREQLAAGNAGRYNVKFAEDFSKLALGLSPKLGQDGAQLQSMSEADVKKWFDAMRKKMAPPG
ncbi:hypothetical protein CYMTET_35032 [Cymbomonas tetramitiformis]|uniref:Uncharacterized protein n=1 Tax=Cymbomonas tetramitiformis TaxID=36881 RepID=A0AAE0F9X1_9CHLO|nr:hypothetical protein CYMTET_35032 [Cymbomonas tetramitiformis]